MRGQALAWSGRLEQEEVFKKKKRKKRHLAAVWGILRQQLTWSPVPLPLPSLEMLPWWWDIRPQAHARRPGDGALPNMPDQWLSVPPHPQALDSVPESATQRQLTLGPCILGTAAEEAGTCIHRRSHGGTPSL